VVTEEGIVIRSDTVSAWVMTMKTDACESCSAKGGCHIFGGGKDTEVEAINTAGAKPGDTVILGFESGSFLKLSFFLYVFPVLSMIIGALVGQETAGNFNIDAGTFSVIAGIGCFLLAFLIIKLVGKRLSGNTRYRANVIKIKFRASSNVSTDND